jgi:hypothetical protein
MVQRRRFSAEYKGEAVAMLESPRCYGELGRRGTGDWGYGGRDAYRSLFSDELGNIYAIT